VGIINIIEKIRVKIRDKLIIFIQQDKVEHTLYKYINDNIKTVRDDLRVTTKDLHSKVSDNKEDIDIIHNTIRNVVSVGADVVPNVMNAERSWAVVCIEGDYNIVKFIDLRGVDYRNILNFLKQYEGSRMVIDAPTFTYFEEAFKMK